MSEGPDRHWLPHDRYTSVAGFTLIETLVVLTILGLIAAGAKVALGPMRDRSLLARSDAALTTLIARARATAIRDGRPVWLRFDQDHHAVAIEGIGPKVSLDRSLSLSLITAQEVGNGTDQGILFLPDGTGSGGRIRLEIAGSRAGARTLRVSWLTGTVIDER